MEPILPGGRGSAVEDVQRRLLVLGYDLGRTGVDGVFLGETRDAVTAFQSENGLSEDGVVGDETWAALVDATFTLGDRTIYLRLPYFHGADVRVLQEALSTLGFACGAIDGIFGALSERAVREFQRNSGQHDDGIAGPETVRLIQGLRHVWEGKDPSSPNQAAAVPARKPEVLRQAHVAIQAERDEGLDLARRIANLALASDPEATVFAVEPGEPTPEDGRIVVRLVPDDSAPVDGVPLVALGNDGAQGLTGRMITALTSLETECRLLEVDLSDTPLAGERECQRQAVRLLDALCTALV